MTEPDPLERLLAEHNADAEPAGDWQARVWAEIAREQPTARPFWVRWAVFGGVAAAALAAVFLLTRPGPPTEPTLGYEVVHRAGGVRSQGVQAGDALAIDAALGGAAHAELRLYRDGDTAVLACGDAPPCRREGDRLTARFTLPSVGSYRLILALGEAPIPGPATRLEQDLARLRQAGVRVESAAPIDVY